MAKQINLPKIPREYLFFAGILAWFSFFMWPKLTPEERESWISDLTRLGVLLAGLVFAIRAPWKIGLAVMAAATAFSSVIGPAIRGFLSDGAAGAQEELGKVGGFPYQEGDLRIGEPAKADLPVSLK